MKDHLRIARKGRVLTAWIEPDGEIFIRESLNRGRDVQTVALTKEELLKIVALEEAK